MNVFQRTMDRFSQNRSLEPVWNLFYRTINGVTKFSPISRHPFLYFFYAKHFKPGSFWKLPGPDTDLLIEGAGSTATFAFTEYVSKFNPGLRIAHGCEVPATVKYAVAHGIPTIVLIRNLIGFVQSSVQRYSQISRRNAVRIYCDYYRSVLPLADRIVVADFYQVKANPVSVVAKCNAFYGLSLNAGDDVLPPIRHTQRKEGPECV